MTESASDLPQGLINGVVDLIHRHRNEPRHKISLDTELGDDLLIDGDDARDLLVDFAKEFEVDIRNFDFDAYFGPEAGFNPFVWLYWKVTGKSHTFKPLTVRALVIAAMLRRLE